MTPNPSMELHAALSRARMLFSMLSSPKLRAALGARLTGREQIDVAARPAGAEHRNGTRDAARPGWNLSLHGRSTGSQPRAASPAWCSSDSEPTVHSARRS